MITVNKRQANSRNSWPVCSSSYVHQRAVVDIARSSSPPGSEVMDIDAKDRTSARDSAYISSAEIDNVSRGAKDSDIMLRYMKGVMTFAGLYYRPLKSCPSVPLDLIFCLFTLLLMTGEFCRVSVLYEASQPFSVKLLRLLSHICIAKDLIIIVLFLCGITPKLRQFSSKYHTYCLNRLGYNDSPPPKVNLKITIFISYFVLFSIRFFINITPSIWPELVDNYSKPYFTNDDPTITRLLGVACSAFFVYYHFIETTAYVFLIVVCEVISAEFAEVSDQLKRFLKQESSDMEEELKDHRKRYLELCRLVSTLDNAVGPLILLLCVFDLLTLVFHVTGFLDVNIVGMSSVWFRVITFLSALDRAMHLGSLIYAGINLNSKALAVKPYLLEIDLSSSPRAFQEALLFIQKVTHDHIGLSASGLFSINKSFIVTAVAIGLSYLIILLRFGIIFGYGTLMKDAESAGPTSESLMTSTPYL